MSSSVARDIDYTGQIAYDLSRFDRRKRVRDTLQQEPVAVPRAIATPESRAKAAASAKVKSKSKISLVTVMSFIIAAVLMFCIVLNYMRLNELTIEISSLKSELSELKSQAAVLRVRNEQNLNVKELEELALSLGMTRPSRDQITYIDLSKQDRGIVHMEVEEGSDFLNGLKTFFLTATNFFK
jgi:cell division protein FtsL